MIWTRDVLDPTALVVLLFAYGLAVRLAASIVARLISSQLPRIRAYIHTRQRGSDRIWSP